MRFIFLSLFTLLLFSNSFSQQSYYNDVNLNLTGQELYFELQVKIDQASNSFTYGDVRDAVLISDEDISNNNNVLLVYGYNDTDGNCTTDRSRDKGDFGGATCQWNREHVFARSNTNPPMGNVDNNTTGIGADPHNIRPCDQQMNNTKGNKKFASGNGNAGIVGSGHWYPGDEWKGDIARMIMYMYTRYGDRCLPSLTGVGNLQGSTNMLQLFLQWNAEDPVTPFEDQRNEYFETLYGNRNPFIDNPYLATIIWGGTPAEDRWDLFSINDFYTASLSVYPNPVWGTLYFETSTRLDTFSVYDILGKVVMVNQLPQYKKEIDLSALQKGNYLIEFIFEEKRIFKRIIIE